MDKHKCKLCFRSFANGRALGGHMRSHMMTNLSLSKSEEASLRTVQLSFEAESASSPSSEDGDEDDEKGMSYGLRENPKRSIRMVDPEFSFAVNDGSFVILHDRESESESSKNNPTRERSKTIRNSNNYCSHYRFDNSGIYEDMIKKKSKTTQSWVDHEPVSSVSDATTEEDVAFCLMMLSRDKWKPKYQPQYKEDEEETDEEQDKESDESSQEYTMNISKNRVRGRYKCYTCNKVFRSYQALGGHRASHKKIKLKNNDEQVEHRNKSGGGGVVEKKVHECPVCFRVFASGQALGGHKRTHVTGSTLASTSTKFGNTFIDLNLPAPFEDDDVSQIENSAVSDVEFVKTH